VTREPLVYARGDGGDGLELVVVRDGHDNVVAPLGEKTCWMLLLALVDHLRRRWRPPPHPP
jgi:hypothetical protein